MGQAIDFTFLIALFFASVAVVLLSLLYVLIPLAKGQAIRKELQAAGARLTPTGSGAGRAGRSLRSWIVPSSARPIQDALVNQLSTKTGVVIERVGTGELLVRGRSSRYWNVNRVDPLDFAQATVELQSRSPAETRVIVRVDFSGYWRAILIVGLFTLWTCFCLWLTSRFRPGSVRVALMMVALGILFLCVRRFAQRQRTGGFFDALIARAIARPPAAPRPPA